MAWIVRAKERGWREAFNQIHLRQDVLDFTVRSFLGAVFSLSFTSLMPVFISDYAFWCSAGIHVLYNAGVLKGVSPRWRPFASILTYGPSLDKLLGRDAVAKPTRTSPPPLPVGPVPETKPSEMRELWDLLLAQLSDQEVRDIHAEMKTVSPRYDEKFIWSQRNMPFQKKLDDVSAIKNFWYILEKNQTEIDKALMALPQGTKVTVKNKTYEIKGRPYGGGFGRVYKAYEVGGPNGPAIAVKVGAVSQLMSNGEPRFLSELVYAIAFNRIEGRKLKDLSDKGVVSPFFLIDGVDRGKRFMEQGARRAVDVG